MGGRSFLRDILTTMFFLDHLKQRQTFLAKATGKTLSTQWCQKAFKNPNQHKTTGNDIGRSRKHKVSTYPSVRSANRFTTELKSWWSFTIKPRVYTTKFSLTGFPLTSFICSGAQHKKFPWQGALCSKVWPCQLLKQGKLSRKTCGKNVFIVHKLPRNLSRKTWSCVGLYSKSTCYW